MEKISVVIAGIGGYGVTYLSELLHHARGQQYALAGAVDPFADRCEWKKELDERNIPIYASLDDFYREHSARLALIATPIPLHARQAIFCMEHGSDVLCEKPICATPEDARAMLAARDRAGRKLAVGYQWCYSEATLRLKEDLLRGVYGRIRRIRTRVLFPRGTAYYHRTSGWAGKRFLASGEAVYDCVASNATAHYLQNMLFLTGKHMDRSAEVSAISTEVYRANPIEMYDTCAFRIFTAEGAELLFYASHAVPFSEELAPEFFLEAEKGTVRLKDNAITGRLGDRTIEYGAPCPDAFRTLDAMRPGSFLPCPAEAALTHLQCVYSVAQSFPEIPEFGEGYAAYSQQDQQYTCRGLAQVFNACWDHGTLPYEERAPWALKPRDVPLL